MKAFLHIGTPKTGTTTLQQFLDTNREQLLKHGILYPETFGLNSMGLVLGCYENGKRDGLSKLYNIESDKDVENLRKKLVGNLSTEVRKYNNLNSTIFSSEYFQLNLHTNAEIELLKSSLNEIGFDQIYIVVYLREQADLANSFYSTSVKAGETAEQPSSPVDNRYRHLCDHRGTLERFGKTFGKSNIIVNIFEKGGIKNNSIIDDFMHIIDSNLNPASLSVPMNKNEALSTEGTLVLSRLNSYFPRWVNGSLNPLRRFVIDFAEEHYANGKYTMPEELYKEYRTSFKSGNDWIRANYFPDKITLFKEKEKAQHSPECSAEDISDSDIEKYAHSILEKSTLFSMDNPGDMIHVGHGISYYHLGQYDKACEYFDLALTNTPDLSLIHI